MTNITTSGLYSFNALMLQLLTAEASRLLVPQPADAVGYVRERVERIFSDDPRVQYDFLTLEGVAKGGATRQWQALWFTTEPGTANLILSDEEMGRQYREQGAPVIDMALLETLTNEPPPASLRIDQRFNPRRPLPAYEALTHVHYLAHGRPAARTYIPFRNIALTLPLNDIVEDYDDLIDRDSLNENVRRIVMGEEAWDGVALLERGGRYFVHKEKLIGEWIISSLLRGTRHLVAVRSIETETENVG